MFVVQKFRYSALNEMDNQCTETLVAVVRSFKIDGDDGGMGGGFTGTHRMAGTAWGHSATRAPF